MLSNKTVGRWPTFLLPDDWHSHDRGALVRSAVMPGRA